MNIRLYGGILMLVAWAVVTVAAPAPGYVHLLLVFGVFFLIWGVTLRGAPARSSSRKKQDRTA